MSEPTIIFFLLICIVILLITVLYQQFAFRTGIQKKIQKISEKLKEITDTNSSERVMVFTENKELMELAAQINRLLENHLKVKADYCRSEIASKKMLSNISHDIKTPMTVILGYLEIMRINGTSTDEMLGKIEQKAENVMELINQFFTLAKLESGDMDIELSRIDVCEVCRESILDFYGILTNKIFQVDIDIPETSVYVHGNKEAIQRILFNLISNVIRYGADGKYLGISLRTDKNAVFIDVIDKGKGIDKNFAASVFDRLFTMEDSRNRNIQGNGLGLTISKNLALQLGGDIILDSTPNIKTVFSVKLKKMSY
ncbi:sensor histidine kinase [Blautia sp. AF14-40]|jgi:signal transduction histidine kinase|uniref:sensor histidine kinase n=1 Tax=Blautia sp. AF14-40 TaxID=2292958 RepID=UPI000E4C307A|nr:sensor histidine kinase [Blautia sp. AF14-40]RGW15935.1 sensor histidine kinase [Ruminococcus sp. AF13-37]RGW17298.1 sensor histidine kinase [Ruminococcus sp. AF13-28]RHS03544.1 sensor histidine kinase [Blautia sp. AF14-40]